MKRLSPYSSVVFALLLAACASNPPPAPAPAATTAAVVPAKSSDLPPASGGGLHRAAVHQVVAAGLGSFLQRIVLDDQPVMVQGKFHGYRVTSLVGDPGFWRDVDLKSGDVVTRVNGFAIEKPEDALEAFRSLEVASELRVDYERNGVPREIRYAIVDP